MNALSGRGPSTLDIGTFALSCNKLMEKFTDMKITTHMKIGLCRIATYLLSPSVHHATNFMCRISSRIWRVWDYVLHQTMWTL
jgi:hypothetical protein